MKYIILLVLILITPMSVNAATIIEHPTGLITTKTTPTIASTAADVVGKTIIITSNYEINDVTFSSGVALIFKNSGNLSIATGKTLTINSASHNLSTSGAGNVVINGYATGNIRLGHTGTTTFATSSVPEVSPNWWKTNTIPGTTDMAVALQSAINSAGRIPVSLTDLEYFSSTSLQLKAVTYIKGNAQYACRIVFDGTDGLVATNIGNIILRDFEIAMKTRHTTTPNTKSGIFINGSSGSPSYNNVFNNILVDGFRNGLAFNWIYSTTVERVHTTNGKTGINVDGLSVNNTVIDSQFLGDGTVDGYGIVFAGHTSEGWMISNSLIYGFGVGVLGVGMSHVLLDNNIIDACSVIGVQLSALSSSPCENWNITNNFIAVTGANLGTGILDNSAVAGSATNVGHRIDNNIIITYNSGTMDSGIDVSAGDYSSHIITNNSIKGSATYDIKGNTLSTITNNVCKTSLAANILSGSIVSNNVGTVYYQPSAQRIKIGEMSITYSSAAPLVGAWKIGDICYNISPAVGQPKGWTCTVAGTPGTWVSQGNL